MNKEKIKETKVWFIIDINKITKYVAKLIQKKKKTQITNIRNKAKNISTDPTKDKKIKKCCKQVHVNCDKCDEFDKFLERQKQIQSRPIKKQIAWIDLQH